MIWKFHLKFLDDFPIFSHGKPSIYKIYKGPSHNVPMTFPSPPGRRRLQHLKGGFVQQGARCRCGVPNGKMGIYHRRMWAFREKNHGDLTISLSKNGIYTVINMVEELLNEDLAIVYRTFHHQTSGV